MTLVEAEVHNERSCHNSQHLTFKRLRPTAQKKIIIQDDIVMGATEGVTAGQRRGDAGLKIEMAVGVGAE